MDNNENCNQGGLLYIQSVIISHPSNDIGLYFVQSLLIALKGRYTLAAMLPALLHYVNKDLSFRDCCINLIRHFSRIGFVQVANDRTNYLNMYSVLDSEKFNANTVLNRSEVASTIIQYKKSPSTDVFSELDKEMQKTIVDFISNPFPLLSMNMHKIEELLVRNKTLDISNKIKSTIERLDVLLKQSSDLKAQGFLIDESFFISLISISFTFQDLYKESLRFLEDENRNIAPILKAITLQMNSLDSIDLFRQKLSDILARGGDVNTALALHHLIANYCLRSSTYKLSIREMIQVLINEFNANVNRQDDVGNSPLHVAVDISTSSIEIISALLEFGADKSIKDSDGETCLEKLNISIEKQKRFLEVSLSHHYPKSIEERKISLACLKLLS